MAAPAIPYYGKDVDRFAKLGIAYNALADSDNFLIDWPKTVPDIVAFKTKFDLYQSSFDVAIHGDRRFIAQRTAACNDAGDTWQKIVNYACAPIEDNSQLLVLMGVTSTSGRPTSAKTRTELQAPVFSVENLDSTGAVRASCPFERRSYTYDVWVTEGDPRIEEGWYHKLSFGDCTKMDMSGFQSGKQYSFRCRLIGKDNSLGPWSHTLTIMVT